MLKKQEDVNGCNDLGNYPQKNNAKLFNTSSAHLISNIVIEFEKV